MVNTFEAKVSFSLNDKDKILYKKFGTSAMELADKGELLSAIKIMDDILKENPNAEFALILKANYLVNYVNKNLHFDNVSKENIKQIYADILQFREKVKESISLIGRAIKINPKNKDSENFKKFIENNTLKETSDLIETIENNKFFRNLTSKNKFDATKVLFEKCPVCKKGKVKLVTNKVLLVFKKEDIICDNCNAKFKYEGEVDGQDTYSLDLSKSNEENKYDGETFKIHEWERGKSDFDYCVDTNTLPTLRITDSKIILQPNELFHLVTDAQLLEERAIRQTYGGAVRVMKGVYVGGSQGESHGVLRKIDNGMLLLTNQRLIFNGALRNAEYQLDKIVSVEEYKDAVEIGARNKQKVQTFVVDEPHKFATFIKMAISHLPKSKKK